MRITNPKDVCKYYQQEKVAEDYIRKRFTEPLNVIEHQRQAAIINKIINSKSCKKVLEFAPGPARITAELDVENGISIDSSASMLKIAKARMKQRNKKWRFLKADVLTFRTKENFDLIFCFRFLLHFKREMRTKIYQQARELLEDNGCFVFEAMNYRVVKLLRQLLGKKRYFVYDKLYFKNELITELDLNGFKVIKLYPVLSSFWLQALLSRPFKIIMGHKGHQLAEKTISFLERFDFKLQPYQWIVLCQKK